MASAQAQIEVVVKNLRSLDKIEKALTKINSQNDKLIASLDKVVGSLSNIEKAIDIAKEKVVPSQVPAEISKKVEEQAEKLELPTKSLLSKEEE